jgi:predicted dehydrogenase
VDFQTRAHPAYQEIVKRTHRGDIGRIVTVESSYHCPLYFASMDAEYRKSPNPKAAEARLRAWAIDRVLSGDVITEQNIHTLDVATWFLDADPIKAYGTGGRARDFLGDCWDHYAVIFFFPNQAFVIFNSKQVGHAYDDIMCRVHGMSGTAETHYSGKVWLKSKEDGYEGNTQNLYVDGVKFNLTTFYDAVTKGDFSNPTVAPSVRSNLTTILGRMAAYEQTEVTWSAMMKKAEKWEFDPKGLKL